MRSMLTRRLATRDVASVGLGCVGMAGAYGQVDRRQAERLVVAALDLGVTVFDTAGYYGPSEEILGAALGARRDEAVICSKFGMRRDQTGGPYTQADPAHGRQACDASLDRLGVDHLDLWQLARIDPFVPIEESVGAMGELVAAGKVGAIGLCEVAPATLRRAAAVDPVASVQTEYSLLERHVEGSILAACREVGAAFIAYCPLSRGLLAGGFDPAVLEPGDWRRLMARFQGADLESNLALVAAVEPVAAARRATPAQVALAWLLAQGDDVIVIPGTRSVDHLAENVAAADLVLTPDELAWLADTIPPGAAAGLRYPESLMVAIDRG